MHKHSSHCDIHHTGRCSCGADINGPSALAPAAGSESLPLLLDEPWPLRGIMAKLVEAADILLDEKSYDGHGWEEIHHCRDRAKAILATQNTQPVPQ